MDVTAFAVAQLPPPPARVLEVGCGTGDLARAVARLGYDIVAIDPQAPDGEIFERVSLEEFAGSGPFDAVLANRALHHIPDLASALDRVTLLLRPGGRLIVHEHAWELMDERTARWYLERRAAIDPSAPASVETCLADWNAGHAGLHGYAELRGALDQRFRERYFAWTPYLHGELGGPEVEREERDLIEAGMIQATGFDYAGEMVSPRIQTGRAVPRMCGISGSKRWAEKPKRSISSMSKPACIDRLGGGWQPPAILGQSPLRSITCASSRFGWQRGITCS